MNAHSTPQWNYTPEGVLASSPQVGLGGAGLGLRSSELYLKCICSKKNDAAWKVQADDYEQGAAGYIAGVVDPVRIADINAKLAKLKGVFAATARS